MEFTEFAIVKKVMAVLKLDDAGKVGKFFAREVKEANRNISAIEANQAGEDLAFKRNMEELNERMEDAVEAVDHAYQNITPEDVKTNADIVDFSENYWRGVTRAEEVVTDLESEKKELVEDKEIQDKENAAQIAKWNARIDKIVGVTKSR
jgi:hypothetical protein